MSIQAENCTVFTFSKRIDLHRYAIEAEKSVPQPMKNGTQGANCFSLKAQLPCHLAALKRGQCDKRVKSASNDRLLVRLLNVDTAGRTQQSDRQLASA